MKQFIRTTRGLSYIIKVARLLCAYEYDCIVFASTLRNLRLS